MLAIRLLATLSIVAATSAPAFADANSDVHNAMIAFGKLRSYHMDMTIRGKPATVDVVNPGQTHVVMPQIESYTIGQTTYVKLNGTPWRKYPGSANPATFGDLAKKMDAHGADYVATDLGTRVVDGAQLHAYQVKKKASGKDDSKIFLDSQGRVARIEAGTAVMRVSKFNEPITIRAPI